VAEVVAAAEALVAPVAEALARALVEVLVVLVVALEVLGLMVVIFKIHMGIDLVGEAVEAASCRELVGRAVLAALVQAV
jgi:hypothetical protein